MKKLLLPLLLTALGMTAKADNWMSRLPDSTPVCLVSIPGSHDTATGDGLNKFLGFIDATSYTQTQDLSLSDQWGIGVRAFDLRPCVSGSSLNINHGPVSTKLTFKQAMSIIADSLAANPSEFAVIHLLHETGGDNTSSKFESILHDELADYSDYLVPFRRDLTVEEMRGKIVILYRDSYDEAPTGGLMTNWKGYIDWSAQTTGRIDGSDQSLGVKANTALYMQDYSDTSADNDDDKEANEAVKVGGIQTMLDYTTTHAAYNLRRNVWVYNFASAYDQTTSIAGYELSLSKGYRENASYTNKAIVDYLSSHSGPTGIILADYVGVDESDGYATMGATLVQTIIENNFKYLPLDVETESGTDISDQLGATCAWDGTTGWTVSSSITCNAGGQHWSGDPSDAYFEQSSSEWSSSSKWSETMTQTISVENGLYRLKAAGRSSTGALCSMTMGDSTYVFPAKGDTGGTIDIDGVEWESLAIGKAAGATFANSNAGRGWNWGSIDALVTDGSLTITVTLQNTSGSAQQWASIDDFQLLRVGTSTDALDQLIEEASGLNTTANLGSEPFQFPADVAASLASALEQAIDVRENENATQDDVDAALVALQAALTAYNETSLNEPEDGQLFNILKDGSPLSFHTDATEQGGYAFDYLSPVNVNYGQAFCFSPSSALKDGYTITFTGTDGKTHYLYDNTGTVFQVVATTEEGVWDIVGFDSGLSFSEAELAFCKPLLVADAYATLVLPFHAELPEGMRAYSCASLEDDGQTLNLVEADALEANTPYFIYCPTGEASTFEGAGTWHDSYSLSAGLLTGTFEETTVGQGCYVLRADEEGTAAFYLVGNAGESLSPNQCYLSLSDSESLPEVLYLPLSVTHINPVSGESQTEAVYDLSGRKVQSPQHGIYIQGGKKLLIK